MKYNFKSNQLEFYKKKQKDDEQLILDQSIKRGLLKDIQKSHTKNMKEQYWVLSFVVDKVLRIEVLSKDEGLIDKVFNILKI